MADKKIIQQVKKYLKRLREKGVHVSFGIMFGSQVKGGVHKWSDIDLVVISPQFDKTLSLKQEMKLWHVAAEIDSRIEPIACGENEWDHNEERIIIEIAHREGIKIELNEAA